LGLRAFVALSPQPLALFVYHRSVLFWPLFAVLAQSLSGAPLDALHAPAGTKAIVLLFTSTDCPISNRYAPELRRIAEAFESKGVVFRLVYPNPAESDSAIREHMSAYAYSGAFEAVRDPEQSLVKYVGATITPEAAVVVHGRVLYRGRIDDRFVDLGRERPAPTQRDLFDTLTAIAAGKPVPHAKTQAVGCFISDLVR
jgi:thiol-disulfide isomerase/thioredoxin